MQTSFGKKETSRKGWADVQLQVNVKKKNMSGAI